MTLIATIEDPAEIAKILPPFGFAHQSSTPCARAGLPSLLDGLIPLDSQFHPAPALSQLSPLAFTDLAGPHCVAILRNIRWDEVKSLYNERCAESRRVP